jgi:hypothetical protein
VRDEVQDLLNLGLEGMGLLAHRLVLREGAPGATAPREIENWGWER